MRKIEKYFPFLLFFVLVFILFYKIFSGFVIQGVDTALWANRLYKNNALFTPFNWNPLFWLGMSSGAYILGIYWICCQIFPVGQILFFTYFISIFLGLVFSYLLLKKLGLSLWGRIFGAICYSFMPPIVTLIYSGHIQVIELLPYIPLIFLCIEEIFGEGSSNFFRKMAFLGLLSICWGLAVNLDVQRGLYITLLAVSYVIFHIFSAEKGKKINQIMVSGEVYKKIGVLFLIGVLSFLVFSNSLPTWLETLKGRLALQNKAQSRSESEKYDFATSWSFHPAELIDSIAFGFHGMLSGDSKGPYWGEKPFSGNSEAIGFFAIFFCIVGLTLCYKQEKRVRFFFWAALILLLLSFGRYWPGKPFFWLFYKLPLMSNFRAPAKFVCIAAFCISILAGMGFDGIINLLMNETEKRKKFFDNLLKTMAILVVLSLLGMFFIMISSSDISFSLSKKFNNNSFLAGRAVSNMIMAILRFTIFLSVSLILIFITMKFNRDKKYILISGGLFIFLNIIDLFTINWFYISKSYVKEDEFYKKDEVVDFLYKENSKEIFRTATSVFLPYQGRSTSIPVTRLKGYYLTFHFPYYGIETLDIPASSTLMEDYENFFLKTLEANFKGQLNNILDVLYLDERLFQLGNVKYVLIDANIQISNLILTNILKALDNNNVYVYYNPDYMPRVTFYESFVSVRDNVESLKYLSDPFFNFKESAVIATGEYKEKKGEENFIPQEIVEYKGWKYKIKINSPVGGVLVGSFKYEDGWKAKVDGRYVKVFPADYLLVGTYVPEGEHIVEFLYEPSKLYFYITLCSLIGCFLIFASGMILSKRGDFLNGRKKAV
ncbi:MAG: YfhO family protein [Brevinematia bacterium]